MQLNFKLTGSGPPILLLHGLFGDLDNLTTLSRAIADRFTVIQVDLRNHGHSPRSQHMNYPAMSSDIIALMNTLEIAQAVLLGHSMGGKVAMQVAINYPERVSRLVVADIAPITYERHHENVFAGLEALWQERHSVENRQDVAEILQQHIKMREVTRFLLKGLPVVKGELVWRIHYPAIRDNYSNILAKPANGIPFREPTLFIKGGDSDYILPQYQDRILKLFPAASAKVIAGTGHWLHAEKPRLFNRLVSEFIS